MKVEIDLDNRLYKDIFFMCNEDETTFKEYLVGAISDTFYTLKYGDLNVKLGLVEPKEDVKPIVEEKPKVEKKKVGRPRKKKEEKPIEEIKPVIIEQKKEEESVVISRKRTLKAK